MIQTVIQLADDAPVIENIENLNHGNVIDFNIVASLIKDPDIVPALVVPKGLVDDLGIPTIGEDNECTTVCVRDFNIDIFNNNISQYAYLFIDDESQVYSNFVKLTKNLRALKSIEFKLRDFSLYNIEMLKTQLEKIVSLESLPLVKNLTGYHILEKFPGYGETAVFVGPDARIYAHPSFYYQQREEGVLGDLKAGDTIKAALEKNIQGMRSHLVCASCPCFYCDRDIYRNKIRTGEYNVPCSNSCKATSLFNSFAKQRFNTQFDQSLTVEEDLDPVRLFKTMYVDKYEKIITENVIENKIKGLSFISRKLG